MDALASRFTEVTKATTVAMAQASDHFNPSTEFGTDNFATRFIDRQQFSDNQARHAIFGLVIGYAHDGVITTAGSWWKYGTPATATALEVANAREDNSPSGLADKALNGLTVPMGERLHGPGAEPLARDLAGWIRNNLCAPR
jgi:hypothetical protein